MGLCGDTSEDVLWALYSADFQGTEAVAVLGRVVKTFNNIHECTNSTNFPNIFDMNVIADTTVRDFLNWELHKSDEFIEIAVNEIMSKKKLAGEI
jgi:hypothetical protein